MEFAKLSPGTQLAIILVLIGGIFLAFYFMIYSKKAAEIKTKSAEFDALQQEIMKAKRTAAKLPELKQRIERLKERFELMKRILPTGRNTQDLLQRVRNLTANSNLALKRFDPAPLVVRELYAEYPVHMRVFGTYQNLKIFFYKISKLPRIINIYNLDIKNVREGPFNIEANYTAVTFVLIEEGT
jgi:type IV pilus assembly protein PilO